MKQIVLMIVLLFLVVTEVCCAEPQKVAFETTDCSGASGFATISVDSIYKIQDGDCNDPNNPEQRLKQLLVHNGSGSYNIYSLGQGEAREVMNEVKAYMKARRGALERSNTIILTE